jgi:DNA-binding XRE family transcriptional regulator
LHVSTIRETVVCPICQLSQFERGNGKCRRCHHLLGISYIEIFLPTPLASLDSQRLIAIRLEVGGLIRRLRFRRGMTQAALASSTGIHRTYLSRAERGQVMPSVIALLQIVSALGADKILLRMRISST